MALADYRLCDVCGAKAFYDARLNYENTRDESEWFRVCGERGYGHRLDSLGDWAVICGDCAKTHRTAIVKKEETTDAKP